MIHNRIIKTELAVKIATNAGTIRYISPFPSLSLPLRLSKKIPQKLIPALILRN